MKFVAKKQEQINILRLKLSAIHDDDDDDM